MLSWIVQLAIQTGMRQSEILQLKVHQVDLAQRVAFLSGFWLDYFNFSGIRVALLALRTLCSCSGLAFCRGDQLQRTAGELVGIPTEFEEGRCKIEKLPQ